VFSGVSMRLKTFIFYRHPYAGITAHVKDKVGRKPGTILCSRKRKIKNILQTTIYVPLQLGCEKMM
jgi:hypothetical protein